MLRKESVSVLPSGLKEDIGFITDNLLKEVDGILEEEEIHVKELILEKEQYNKKCVEEKRLRTVRARRHHKLALRGLSNLIEFGRSVVLQKLLDTRVIVAQVGGEDFEDFIFYRAVRFSGNAFDMSLEKFEKEMSFDEWNPGTRDATIFLGKDKVSVTFGSLSSDDMRTNEFLYSDTLRYSESLRDMVFLGDCGRQDPITALDLNQRIYEWDPSSIAAKVIMDCAYPERFQKYLSIALKNAAKQ